MTKWTTKSCYPVHHHSPLSPLATSPGAPALMSTPSHLQRQRSPPLPPHHFDRHWELPLSLSFLSPALFAFSSSNKQTSNILLQEPRAQFQQRHGCAAVAAAAAAAAAASCHHCHRWNHSASSCLFLLSWYLPWYHHEVCMILMRETTALIRLISSSQSLSHSLRRHDHLLLHHWHHHHHWHYPHRQQCKTPSLG